MPKKEVRPDVIPTLFFLLFCTCIRKKAAGGFSEQQADRKLTLSYVYLFQFFDTAVKKIKY